MPHVHTISHGRSSTSLKDEGQPKRKLKQFTAGKLIRNSSYGKLSRIRSTESCAGLGELTPSHPNGAGPQEKPKFGRSKSSGDVLKLPKSSVRLGSLTKLLASHRNKIIIDLTHADDSSQEESSETESESREASKSGKYGKPKTHKGEPQPALESEPEEVESFDDDVKVIEGPTESAKKDLPDTSSYDATYLLSQSTGQQRQVPRKEASNVDNPYRNNYTVSETSVANDATTMQKRSSSSSLIFQQSGLNLAGAYNGSVNPQTSLLRSQQFHKFMDPKDLRDVREVGDPRVSHDLRDHRGLRKSSTVSMHQAITARRDQHNDKTGSITNTEFQKPVEDAFANNFNSYLSTAQPKLETRTQQRLWLQRENLNSLVDLSDSNNPFTTNLTRMEYEKLSREYLNIRRFRNPVFKSIVKIDNIPGVDIKKSIGESTKSFGDFKAYEDRIAALWKKNSQDFFSSRQEEIQKASVSTSINSVVGTPQRSMYYKQQPHQNQQKTQQYSTVPFNRLPQQFQPTTRAQQKVTKSSSLSLVNLQN
ncbi:hypothetical protein FOA43_000991 [Brettanomyces nanus]|uniref:Uncharacterized protein n=1 Tax=Eeniella nana TaxID=13502 RepID=A0A875RYA6_EENNA|nr:uncharacterized protein FOA43_000991 [Brettanomyces nanus]QPG73678.1 hypothetical protein FOA43_000991 [Brettanomyces nanus]